MEEKPFDPSQRKLKKAREKGEVPRSTFLIQSCTTLATLIILGLISSPLMRSITQAMRHCFQGVIPTLRPLFVVIAFLGIFAFLTPIIVQLIKTKGAMSFAALTPKWRRKETFSLVSGLLTLGKVLLPLLVLGCYLPFIRTVTFSNLYLFCLIISSCYVILALLDWKYRQWKFIQNQKMSAAEKKEEEKEQGRNRRNR